MSLEALYSQKMVAKYVQEFLPSLFPMFDSLSHLHLVLAKFHCSCAQLARLPWAILVDHKGVGGSGEDSAGTSECFSTTANAG